MLLCDFGVWCEYCVEYVGKCLVYKGLFVVCMCECGELWYDLEMVVSEVCVVVFVFGFGDEIVV